VPPTIGGVQTKERTLRSVAVFCGSSLGARPAYAEAARETGRRLAERGLRIVYGGGRVGLMGLVADAALAAGGEVHGVIPEKLWNLEVAHTGLTALDVVPDMHQRKLRMAELADAFIALPGGYGTLDEVFEAATWTQLEYHTKPVGLLDVEDFFADLVRYLDRAATDGFVRAPHRPIVVHARDLDTLLTGLVSAPLPTLDDLRKALPK
jgi:uncharacterized protein (TIGR00730 family)